MYELRKVLEHFHAYQFGVFTFSQKKETGKTPYLERYMEMCETRLPEQSFFYKEQASFISRGVFRTHSDIHDRAFVENS